MPCDPDDTYFFDPLYGMPDKMVHEHFGTIMIDSADNQGQTVKLVSKPDIIAEHKSKSTNNKPSTSESHFVYFKREPPCSKPLSSLRRIFVKDLKLGWDSGYHDAVVVLRTIAPPRRFGDALQTVTEDEQGNCIYLRFYGPIAGVHVDNFLPEGSVVAVKAPWCESNRIQGTAIVVKYLTDFVRLAQGGILYPAKWNLSVPPSASSASEWFKEEGNNAYKSQKYQTAVVRYTEALNFKPHETLEITIYSNRAQAHLASGAFEAAIADATFVFSRDPQHEKSLYRCAMGHYYMQNYAAAIELLNSLIQAYPSNEIAPKDLQRATQRRREQTTGAYDFAEMLKVSRGPSPQMDVADYIGPVEQRAGGLFATRDISVGDLLMCTKAFEFVYSNNSDKGVFFNNHVSGASTLRLSKKIAQKLASNPSFIPSFKKLHHFPPPTSGNIAGNISDELVDGRPVIDDYLIESILNPQSFAMRCVHGDQHNYSGIGLSLTPPYIRHDCLGNCSRAVIGDVVIYRASRDIKSGAPIFVPYFPAWMEVEERQGRLSCYDIYCICSLCQSQMGDKDYHDHRLAAVGAFFGTLPTAEDIFQDPLKAVRELEELCTRLERTYMDHPTIQPRFHSAGKFALLGTCYELLGNREKQLETSLRGLSALGFDAKVDATGHLLVKRHGHHDRKNVVKLAEMQASSFQAAGLVTQAATWRVLARKARDIRFGHWSFTDYSTFGRERRKNTSDTD